MFALINSLQMKLPAHTIEPRSANGPAGSSDGVRGLRIKEGKKEKKKEIGRREEGMC